MLLYTMINPVAVYTDLAFHFVRGLWCLNTKKLGVGMSLEEYGKYFLGRVYQD